MKNFDHKTQIIHSLPSKFSYLRCRGFWRGCCTGSSPHSRHGSAQGCAQQSTWLHAGIPGSACWSAGSPRPGKPTRKKKDSRVLQCSQHVNIHFKSITFSASVEYQCSDWINTYAYLQRMTLPYLVFDFREQSAGPVKEVLSKSHFVVVVFIAPFAYCGVLPFLEPFVLHHRENCHARFTWGSEFKHTTFLPLYITSCHFSFQQ